MAKGLSQPWGSWELHQILLRSSSFCWPKPPSLQHVAIWRVKKSLIAFVFIWEILCFFFPLAWWGRRSSVPQGLYSPRLLIPWCSTETSGTSCSLKLFLNIFYILNTFLRDSGDLGISNYWWQLSHFYLKIEPMTWRTYIMSLVLYIATEISKWTFADASKNTNEYQYNITYHCVLTACFCRPSGTWSCCSRTTPRRGRRSRTSHWWHSLVYVFVGN